MWWCSEERGKCRWDVVGALDVSVTQQRILGREVEDYMQSRHEIVL